MGPAIKDVGNEEGHFVLNMDFTWTFIRKQNETEKSKISVIFCVTQKTVATHPLDFGCL